MRWKNPTKYDLGDIWLSYTELSFATLLQIILIIYIPHMVINAYMYMAQFASQRINIICIKIKIMSVLYNDAFHPVNVRVSILLTCVKHLQLHYHIISLRGEVWAHKTTLTQPLFYWRASNKPGEWSCIQVFWYWLYLFSTIFQLNLENILTLW